MGMFDDVVCRYPLPHHQDARFQTKDLAGIALGEQWITGRLDEYEISLDGRLRRHVHERERIDGPSAFLSRYMKSVRDWWESVPDAHGDVWIYTTDSAADVPSGLSADGDSITDARNGRWIEFRIRFTNGRVQDVEDLSRPLTPDAESCDAVPPRRPSRMTMATPRSAAMKSGCWRASADRWSRWRRSSAEPMITGAGRMLSIASTTTASRSTQSSL